MFTRLTLAISLFAICMMVLLASPTALAQSDPLVGTWNMKGTGNAAFPPFIAVMTFNAGGTTVEFDSAGSNSSASPGESIVLGRWSKTAKSTYTFKEENYVYNSSGNLFAIAISAAHLALGATSNTFTGALVTKFFNCTVSLCPGTLIATTPSATITGKRL